MPLYKGVEQKVLILIPLLQHHPPRIIPVRESLPGRSLAQTVVYGLDHFSTGKVGPTCSKHRQGDQVA